MADTKEIIMCPACGKNLVKIYIENADRYVDICLEGCGGIFFDNCELEMFDEDFEEFGDILTFYDKDERKFTPVDDEQLRKCPSCNAIMTKIGNGTPDKTFKIDCCYNCGSKFLDAYELEKIRKACGTEKDRQIAFNQEFMKIFGSEIEKTNARHAKIKPDHNPVRNFIAYLASVKFSSDNQEFANKFAEIINKHSL